VTASNSPASAPAAPNPAAANPSADLFRLISGFQVTQALHVAAVLGIADRLRDGSRSAAELAAATETNCDALYRLMRALAAIGVFREEEGRRFAQSPMSEFLRTDKPGSLNGLAHLFATESYWRAWGDLRHGIKTGAIPFDHVYGESVWAFRSARPDESALFDRTMAGTAERVAAATLAAYDFSRFGTIVDIGGGQGAFIMDILAAHSRARGILFDQPHVAGPAGEALRRRGLDGRCEIVGGDFFAGVPAGGDAYILKRILHDWDDAASLAILRSCRRAMQPGATLVVVEQVVGPPNTDSGSKFMDLNMLVITGGIERTEAEYGALLAQAGFNATRMVPTESPVAVVEGVAV
jgi:hypothetical protein